MLPAIVAKRIERRFGRPLIMPELRVRVTKGSTFENVGNLAPSFLANIVQKYRGTRLGRQELYAELLPDNPAALWKRDRLDQLRVEAPPELIRICVAIDPSGSAGENANECGIIVAGEGSDGDVYILADASKVLTPAEWGGIALELYEMAKANAIVAEKNFGGLMVEEVIRAAARRKGIMSPPIKLVQASRGKYVRAEPVALLYEQNPGHVHHVGNFLELEDEMVTWTPSDKRSPNRLDALVWAVHHLARFHEPRYGSDYGIF